MEPESPGRTASSVMTVVDELLAFHDFPAEHWIHLHTTGPIDSAQQRWRALNARPASSPWSGPEPASKEAGSSNGHRRPRHE